MPGERLSEVYIHELAVQHEDLDEMNHANNLSYLRWCLRAAVAHSDQVGWSSQRYFELGCGFIVRAHKIKYRIPAKLGDQIHVRTWIATMDKVSSDRRYEVVRVSDQKKLAEAETTWVFVDLQSLELQRIPDSIRESFLAT